MIDKKDIEKRLAILADGEKCIVTKVIDLKDHAHLVAFRCKDELDCSCIVYDDGTLMHLQDWQSGYPESGDDIEDYNWITEDGRDAVLMNGLPRTFA